MLWPFVCLTEGYWFRSQYIGDDQHGYSNMLSASNRMTQTSPDSNILQLQKYLGIAPSLIDNPSVFAS